MKRPLLIAAALALGVAAGTAQAANPTSRVAQGALAGTTDGNVSSFLGIPYAAPPTGPNRWRAPQAPAKWSGVKNADRFAPNCSQDQSKAGFGPYTAEYLTAGEVSENCLYLNVWAPAKKAQKRLPVLVWIHGGAFFSGSGSIPIYSGAALARQDAVVVTINYRLGLFGFFAHPELTREAGGAPPANFGLQDQIAALRWVHDNIAAFGGDPSQVTVAGQSAGAMSVHYLLASKLAKGLFVRAIAQSGLPDWFPLPALADAERAGEAFAQSKGAGSLEALRALSTETLAAKGSSGAPSFTGIPVVDGQLIQQSPEQWRAQGRPLPVPLLTGFNADEAFDPIPVTDAASFKAKAERDFGPFADRMAPFYPAQNPAEAARALSRDRINAGLYAWQRRSRKGGAPAYAYLFTHREPGPQSDIWRSFHSSEIPYVFGMLDAAPERPFTAKDRELSNVMGQYWLNFVRTGNPNGRGLPQWPVFASPSFDLMELGESVKPRPILPAAQLKVMDEYLDNGGGTGPFDAVKRAMEAAKAALGQSKSEK